MKPLAVYCDTCNQKLEIEETTGDDGGDLKYLKCKNKDCKEYDEIWEELNDRVKWEKREGKLKEMLLTEFPNCSTE